MCETLWMLPQRQFSAFLKKIFVKEWKLPKKNKNGKARTPERAPSSVMYWHRTSEIVAGTNKARVSLVKLLNWQSETACKCKDKQNSTTPVERPWWLCHDTSKTFLSPLTVCRHLWFCVRSPSVAYCQKMADGDDQHPQAKQNLPL